MKNFRAVTKSGTVWEYAQGLLTVRSSRGLLYDQTFKPITFKNINVADAIATGGADMTVHQYAATLPSAEDVIVGDRLYAYGFGEWRLSTEVAEVEFF